MAHYHREVYWPFPAGTLPAGRKEMIYTTHAKTRAFEYGKALPKYINLTDAYIFEAEVIGKNPGRLEKIVFRVRYNDKYDIVVATAMLPNKSKMIARTVWFNEHNDQHSTLDTRKYETK